MEEAREHGFQLILDIQPARSGVLDEVLVDDFVDLALHETGRCVLPGCGSRSW
jgi:hypothetical protein